MCHEQIHRVCHDGYVCSVLNDCDDEVINIHAICMERSKLNPENIPGFSYMGFESPWDLPNSSQTLSYTGTLMAYRIPNSVTFLYVHDGGTELCTQSLAKALL